VRRFWKIVNGKLSAIQTCAILQFLRSILSSLESLLSFLQFNLTALAQRELSASIHIRFKDSTRRFGRWRRSRSQP
jgi:hypothetical protein